VTESQVIARDTLGGRVSYGIVIKGVENTIKAVGEIAREGMRGTDDKIIDIMMQN